MRIVTSVLLVLAAVSTSCGSVGAEDDAVEKYKNYFPEQIKSLPEATRESEVPIMYNRAATTGTSPWAKDLFSMQLNTLFYNGLGDYLGAVRAFQNDVGDAPTGKLTVWQIFQLNYRSEMQKVTPPGIFHNFISGKTQSGAFVHGTMTLLDERPAWPVNYVRLACYKGEGYCRLDELDVQPPTNNDWVYDFTVIWTDALYYKILNWSEDTISAEYESPEGACRSTSLELNFKTKEFYLITKNTAQDCEVLGQKMERLKKPRISQIVDGEKIVAAEYKEFKNKTYEMLSSEFRTRIEKYAVVP